MNVNSVGIQKRRLMHAVARKYASGMSTNDVSELYGISTTTVIKYARACGVKIRSKNSRVINQELLEKGMLAYQSGLSIEKSSRLAHVPRQALSNELKRKGIPIKYGRYRMSGTTKDRICEMYKSGNTYREIADELNVSNKSIIKIIRDRGIETRNCIVTEETSNMIKNMYLKGYSLCAISIELGVPKSTINNKLIECGLKAKRNERT